jgi:hypothetical protein
MAEKRRGKLPTSRKKQKKIGRAENLVVDGTLGFGTKSTSAYLRRGKGAFFFLRRPHV